MKGSFALGKIAGISIYIHYSWFIIFALITWTLAELYFPLQNPGWSTGAYYSVSLITSLLFFASVLAHELSHSLVAMGKGTKVERITLFIFGGLAQIEKDVETPGEEFIISIVGPLSSLCLGFLFAGLGIFTEASNEKISAMAWYLSAINLLLAIFNMAPGFPLDGGRVLRSILWAKTKNIRLSTQITAYIGQGLAYLLFAVGLFVLFSGNILSGGWFVLIGWFLHSSSTSNYQQVLVQERLKEIKVKDIMSQDFEVVAPETRISDLMSSARFQSGSRSAVVSNEGELVGIVSLDDAQRIEPSRWDEATARDVMKRPEELDTVEEEDNGSIALVALNRHGQTQLPVLHDGRLVGLLSRIMLLRRAGFRP